MIQEVRVADDCILFQHLSIGLLGINSSFSHRKAEVCIVGREINNLDVKQIVLRNLVKLNFLVDEFSPPLQLA